MKKVIDPHALFMLLFPRQQERTMKTIVTLSNGSKSKTFIANGRSSDVSDRIVKIKRAFKIRMTHSTQSV